MSDLAGAVDLSTLSQGETPGPKEWQALLDELKQMAATRERALREVVRLEEERDTLEFALRWMVHQYGQDDGHGKRYVLLPADTAGKVKHEVVEFVLDPDRHGLHLIATIRQGGRWNVTGDKPTEKELETLSIYEQLPIVGAPGPQTIIVKTIRGLRIAHWTPEGVDSGGLRNGGP